MDEPTQAMDGARMLAGRYRLVERIGRGGMATVFRATDELLGRDVAVKILDLAAPSKDPAAAERFRREARTTASLSHDNIVTVFDTGLTDDHAFLVMELLPGETLADEVRSRGPLPTDEVASIGAQVAAALAAAHDRGILHRDIKPGNIARSPDGRIKVLDFGITRLVDEAQDTHGPLTMPESIIGTAQYLSPEQAAGKPADRRSDLYALGCVLFTLLSGRPPFRGETPVATLMQHATAPIPDLAELRPDAAPELVALVTALMAKDPDARPQSADVVAARLRGVTNGAEAPTVPLGRSGDAASTPRTKILGTAAVGASSGAALNASRQAQAAPAGRPAGGRVAREEPRTRGSALPWVLLLTLLALGGIGAYAVMNGWDPMRTAVVETPAPSTPEVTSPDEAATEGAEPAQETPAVEETEPAEEPVEEPVVVDPPAEEPAEEPVEEEPAVVDPPSEQPASDAVDQASAALSDAIQEAFTTGAITNDDRKGVEEGLRELDRALREGSDQRASDALSAVDQALSDSDRKDDFEALYETLKDAVDDWEDTLG